MYLYTECFFKDFISKDFLYVPVQYKHTCVHTLIDGLPCNIGQQTIQMVKKIINNVSDKKT